MKSVHRSVLIWYSAQEMFSLVTDVEQYPKFLPWCDRSKVIALEPGDVVATGVHHTALFPVQGGDRIEVQIEKLGPPLRVSVRDALNREWER